MPSVFANRLRASSEPSRRLAKDGKAQPSVPNKSTKEKTRWRIEKPWRLIQACSSSAFSNDMLTFEGHSVVQALQDKQLLSAASSSRDFNGSRFSRPRIARAARMA